MKKYDIIVAGGGISGAIAAIAAARLGKKVLIVEQYGCLGGMLTSGGVGPMMTFHAGDVLAVQGITNELIERMKKKGKSTGHIFDTTGYTYSVTPFDAEGMKWELENMLIEAGGEVLYHALVVKTCVNDGILKSIIVATKSDMFTLSADIFIDATGDANLAYLSGVRFTEGREGDGACQPLTSNIKMYNVDIERCKDYIRNPENIAEFSRIKNDLNIVDRAERLSIGGFEMSFKDGFESGELSFERGEVLFFETNNPGEVIVNTTRVPHLKATDAWEFSKAETIARKQVFELEAFLKKKIPGFENAVMAYSGPSTVGTRSSRQIVGVYTLNEDELISCKKFDDVIAHGGYKIDIHTTKGSNESAFSKELKSKKELEYGAMYSIPYRTLINRDVKNIITVGRCISVTFMAQGAIRVSPIAGAVGHAGGVAAALAQSGGVLPEEISVKELQSVLCSQGAFLEI